jgi:hypothetical protein
MVMAGYQVLAQAMARIRAVRPAPTQIRHDVAFFE